MIPELMLQTLDMGHEPRRPAVGRIGKVVQATTMPPNVAQTPAPFGSGRRRAAGGGARRRDRECDNDNSY
jgi:hypothetical protein